MRISSDGTSLREALGLQAGSCIAVIGAGGKTTTVMGLADELAAAGERVVIATTTKIWPPAGLPVVYPDLSLELSAETPAPGQCLVLAARLGQDAKLHGLPPGSICAVLERWPETTVLCEADGAAGRSLKAHRPGEPVIPGCASTLVVVAGVDSVGRAIDAKTVHRPEIFAQLVSAPEGSTISPRHVALALRAAAAHSPAGARRVYLLSKVDDVERAETASLVADLVHRLDPGSPIVFTSRARVVGVLEPLSGACGSR